MVHNDLLTFLFSDNLTGKSFFEIGQTISIFRLQRFMLKKAQILARHDGKFPMTNQKTISHVVPLDDFGSMDDHAKYNEPLQPSSEFLIDLHKLYVDARIEIIEEFNNSQPIHDV